MRFVDLPDVIYILLKSFLSVDDFIELVSSSKRYFQEIRRSNLYFWLNSSKSESFCVDKSYQDYILSLVTHPDRQIKMILSIDLAQSYKNLFSVHRLYIAGHINYSLPVLPTKGIILSESTTVQDITSLSRLEYVYIGGCNGITDISALANVKDVIICRCDNIRDFSALGKQESLRLFRCPTLTDVNSFSNIQNLRISTCESLFDVSPLYGIPFLLISDCANVKDISCLGNHTRLEISYCGYDLKGYQIFATVKEISLHLCDITDISMMKKARSVELQHLDNLKDVSSLANVKKLILFNCKEIEDISMLDKVRDLQLGSFPTIRRHDSLEHHPNLTIRCYQNEENMDTLIKFRSVVRTLYLGQINVSAFMLLLPSFNRLIFLSIMNDEDFELQGCEDIHTVRLDYCSKIKSTKGLGRNRQVFITACNEMNDVSHLANVPVVTIHYCGKVIDVRCLKNVPRLKILSGVN